MDFKDKHGNKVGSIDKGILHDYNIKDKHGNTVGHADKDFLSSDFTLRTNSGEKIGKAEKNLIGDGYTAKDEKGNKIHATTSSKSGLGFDFDLGEGGTIVAIVFFVIILFSFLGIKYIPEFFAELFDFSDGGNWLYLGPLFIFIIANILMIVLKKDQFIAEHPILYELLGATAVIIIEMLIITILMWETNAEQSGFFGSLGTIFLSIIEILFLMPSLIVLFLPVGLIFGIVIAIKNKLK